MFTISKDIVLKRTPNVTIVIILYIRICMCANIHSVICGNVGNIFFCKRKDFRFGTTTWRSLARSFAGCSAFCQALAICFNHTYTYTGWYMYTYTLVGLFTQIVIYLKWKTELQLHMHMHITVWGAFIKYN